MQCELALIDDAVRALWESVRAGIKMQAMWTGELNSAMGCLVSLKDPSKMVPAFALCFTILPPQSLLEGTTCTGGD